MHPPAARCRTVRAASLLLGLALLAGCSSWGGSDSSGAASDDSGGSAGGGAAGAPEAGAGPAALAPGTAPDTAPDRQVVTTADATLAVDDPAAVAQRVSELVEQAGGRVEERTEESGPGAGDDAGAADLVVRVPAAELTGLLAALARLGDVAGVSVQRSDVTMTAVDLDARISALRTSVGRLQALMDDAASTAALLEAEKALSERQADLESLQSQRAQLADQVALSTLSVHLQPVGVAPAGGPDGFGDGVGTGWRALVSTLGAAAVVLGVLLPWLGVAALVAGPVLLAVRAVRRRGRAEPAAAPPPQA